VRQLCIALVTYSAENKGKFPPNINTLTPTPSSGYSWNYWFDADRIGKYLPKPFIEPGTDAVGGPVMACPARPEEARSYAMNVWASCTCDQYVLNKSPQRLTYYRGPWSASTPFTGSFFSASTKGGPRLILITERWAEFPSSAGLQARATVGFQGSKAGERFLGIPGGVSFNGGANVATELDYTRHRKKIGQNRESKGRITIGFAAGHVEVLAHNDLADETTKLSRFRALWSPYDTMIP
jgi:hypothetical protein